MKAILEFNIPEETEAHEDALKGSTYKWQIEDIWQKVFRPAFKHGYADPELNKLAQSKNGQRLIELLAEEYRKCVKD